MPTRASVSRDFEAFSCWADRADVADTSGFVFGLVDGTPQGRFIGLLDHWASHLVSQAPEWRLAIDDFSEGGGFPGFYAGRVVQEFVLEPIQGASTAWIERDAVAGGVAVVGAVFKPVRAADKFVDTARRTRTATDRLAQHTKVSDLSGAARDAVGLPSNGQHFKEVSEAAGALRIRIDQINSGLSNPNLSSARRAELSQNSQRRVETWTLPSKR